MSTTPAGICAAYEASWNAHDMERFAKLFHPDASFVNRFATYWRGRDAIVAGHKAIHETVYSDSQLRIDPPDVRMLIEEIALLHFWTRLTAGDAHPAGPHQADTLVMAVVTCREGEWRILAAENVTLTDPRSGREVLRKDAP